MLIACLLLLRVLHAADSQALRGFESARLISTERFDIYYSGRMAPEALRLSGFADSTLADLEAIFGKFPGAGKMPVLITDIQPELNGYAIPYPSNRIVLYVAKPDPRESLASFDDEVRLVFTHELVHMVNMNDKAPFWRLVAAILGDLVTPAAWTMPYALLEGTAVWIESGIEEGSGRLNDPAALESVRTDLEWGLERSVWDVSGLLEYPGSGSLPYLYGGLFVEYFTRQFGREALAELWHAAGEGNIFGGFEGTPGISGIIEQVTGKKAGEVWADFLGWAGERLGVERVGGGMSGDRPLARGRFGALASDGSKIYFLDLERRGVFELEIRPATETTVSAKRLFPADPYLKSMRMANTGKSLALEWIKTAGDGTRRAQDYEYDLATTELRPVNDTQPDAAIPEWSYALLRIGARVVPGRISRDGSKEYIDFGEGSLRSLQEDGPSLLALSLTPKGSASKIAVLREKGGRWELLIQKSAPPGGAHIPCFMGKDGIAYVARLPEGKEELRLLDFSAALASGDFEAKEVSWLALPESKMEPEEIMPASQGERKVLFPRVLASVRYPYVENKSAGVAALGSDLSERLSWKAHVGWEFDSKVPETGMEIRLAASGHELGLRVSDSAAASSKGFARVSGVSLDWSYSRRLLPVSRVLGTGAFATVSGVMDSYTPELWLRPNWTYSSLGGGLSLSYSDMAYDAFAPFDLRGGSANLAADYEFLPGKARAMSVSGSISLASARPGLKLSAYGSYSPPGGLRFLPSGRYFYNSGTSWGSALATQYPYYKEYSAIDAGSSWYGFASLEARLLAIETGRLMEPVRLPLIPPWTLRRFSILAGARIAAMELSSGIILPASGFLALETDFALLAGFASQSHILASFEAAYAFDEALAGGNPIFIQFGFGVWY